MLQYRSLKQLLLFTMAACIFITVSCKKDDSPGSGGTPSIRQIRAIAPKPNDSVLTAALPGQYVVIQGARLASTVKVMFDGFPATINSALFSDSNLVVMIPTIAWDSIPAGKLNTIEVTTAGGTVKYTFTITPPLPAVQMASDENAVAGTTVTLTGTNLYGVTSVIFPGGKQGTNVVVNGTTQVTVTVPDGITSGGLLQITGTYGTGSSTFVFDNYLSPAVGFLANFEDGDGFFGWQYWGGIKTNDASLFANNTGNFIRIHPSSSINAGDGSWYSDNRAVMVASGAWLPAANLADPIAGYALKFEINVKTPWVNGSLMVVPAGNFSYMARYAPWSTTSSGQFVTNGWQTVIIPLTSFLNGGAAAPTIATLTGGGNAATIQIMLYNDSTTPLDSFDAGVDNVRIVKI